MKIKTAVKYHCTTVRMDKCWNTSNTKCWCQCGIIDTNAYPLLLLGIQNGTTTLEDGLVVCCTIKHSLTISSSNWISWYFPKELKMYAHTKTCTQICIAALFIIIKTWKPPRCPLVDEWINKMWYIYTIECHSALKRNVLSSHDIIKIVLITKWKWENEQSKETKYILYDSNTMAL